MILCVDGVNLGVLVVCQGAVLGQVASLAAAETPSFLSELFMLSWG